MTQQKKSAPVYTVPTRIQESKTPADTARKDSTAQDQEIKQYTVPFQIQQTVHPAYTPQEIVSAPSEGQHRIILAPSKDKISEPNQTGFDIISTQPRHSIRIPKMSAKALQQLQYDHQPQD